jgi:hypothetical protein
VVSTVGLDFDEQRLGVRESLPRWPVVAAALVFAWLSVVVQGFSIGNNNIFHLPIVFDWSDKPDFRDDAFVRSLRFFVSGFWIAARFLVSESDYEIKFYLAHVLVRWATILSLLFATNVTIPLAPGMQTVAALLLALTPMLRGVSHVGEGDLFISYFSHTELTHPLVLVCLSLSILGRIDIALALNGVVFDINAFVAFWNAVAIAAVVLALVVFRRIDARVLLGRTAAGLAAFLVLALPVAIWIGLALQGRPAYDEFDFVAYLREYWPHHFLIEAASSRGLLTLIAVTAAGFIAFAQLGHPGRIWQFALLGLCFLFMVGVVLPAVTRAPLLLNLHLLRVTQIIQFLALLGYVALALKCLGAEGFTRMSGAASLVILSLPVPAGMLAGVALILLASRATYAYPLGAIAIAFLLLTADYEWPRQTAITGVVALICVAAIAWRARFPSVVLPNRAWLLSLVLAVAALSAAAHFRDRTAKSGTRIADLRAIAHWAKETTDPASIFLVPPDDAQGTPVFQIVSHRRIWVDWKRGAAVMWMPAYYGEWSTRLREVRALRSGAERLRYACANAIDYVLHDKRDAGIPLGASVAVENDHYGVLDAPRSCALARKGNAP